MMIAAKKGHFECCEILLYFGAKVYSSDCPFKHAPWNLALIGGHKDLAVLLKKAADEMSLNTMCRQHCAKCMHIPNAES